MRKVRHWLLPDTIDELEDRRQIAMLVIAFSTGMMIGAILTGLLGALLTR